MSSNPSMVRHRVRVLVPDDLRQERDTNGNPKWFRASRTFPRIGEALAQHGIILIQETDVTVPGWNGSPSSIERGSVVVAPRNATTEELCILADECRLRSALLVTQRDTTVDLITGTDTHTAPSDVAAMFLRALDELVNTDEAPF